MYKNVVSLLLVLPLIFIISCSNTDNPEEVSELLKVADYEGGIQYLTKNGKFNVLELNGTWHQMGRQYGYLLKAHIREVYDVGIAYLGSTGISFQQMVDTSKIYFDLQPQSLQDFITGMDEANDDLDLDQHIVLSQLNRLMPSFSCSFLATWSDFTSNQQLYIGRNWDSRKNLFNSFTKFLTVTIFNPSDNSNSLAFINFAGIVNAQTGINEHGLYLNINDASMMDEANYTDRAHVEVHVFNLLNTYSDLQSIDAALNTERASNSVILNAADPISAVSYQWPTFGLHKRESTTLGILSSTNHFINPPSEWTGQLLELPSLPELAMYTEERRNNLISLSNENKGDIDFDKMRIMMDKSIGQGGAVFDNNDVANETVYQIIARPSDLTFWVKVRGYSDWEIVKLGDFMK